MLKADVGGPRRELWIVDKHMLSDWLAQQGTSVCMRAAFHTHTHTHILYSCIGPPPVIYSKHLLYLNNNAYILWGPEEAVGGRTAISFSSCAAQRAQCRIPRPLARSPPRCMYMYLDGVRGRSSWVLLSQTGCRIREPGSCAAANRRPGLAPTWPPTCPKTVTHDCLPVINAKTRWPTSPYRRPNHDASHSQRHNIVDS